MSNKTYNITIYLKSDREIYLSSNTKQLFDVIIKIYGEPRYEFILKDPQYGMKFILDKRNIDYISMHVTEITSTGETTDA